MAQHLLAQDCTPYDDAWGVHCPCYEIQICLTKLCALVVHMPVQVKHSLVTEYKKLQMPSVCRDSLELGLQS